MRVSFAFILLHAPLVLSSFAAGNGTKESRSLNVFEEDPAPEQAACETGDGGIRRLLAPGVVIDNGVIKLGVQPEGQLNVGLVGLQYMPVPGSEATSWGCPCEGWGVGADGTAGYANEATGNNIPSATVTFASTASTAVSTVEIPSGKVRVTHDYHPSPSTPNLYEVLVTLENTSGAVINDIRYRRKMDWDISPTPFRECVTIQPDPSTVPYLAHATNWGFGSNNPYSSMGGFLTAPFADEGPHDHGAGFDFIFDPLPAGESLSFKIFYGGAPSQIDAETALAAVGAEAYSLGKSTSGGSCNDSPVTYIFAFSNVGGTPIFNNPPTAICQGVQVHALTGCTADPTPEMVDGGSTDPDFTDELSLSISPAGPFGLGNHTVILTVTDPFGLADSCEADIQVHNNAPIVDVGGPYVVFVGHSLVLDGKANDEDSDSLSVVWSTDCDLTFDNDMSLTPTINILSGAVATLCNLTMTVMDACDTVSDTATLYVVNPNKGFVTGGGFIESNEGAIPMDPLATGKANFGLSIRYKRGHVVPSGSTRLNFSIGNFTFHAESFDWLVVTTFDCAKFQGVGKVFGQAEEHHFMVTACDNGEPGVFDTIRMKIWDATTDIIVYDTNMDLSDDSFDGSELCGGNIQVH